jgi:hypothetical protein
MSYGAPEKIADDGHRNSLGKAACNSPRPHLKLAPADQGSPALQELLQPIILYENGSGKVSV